MFYRVVYFRWTWDYASEILYKNSPPESHIIYTLPFVLLWHNRHQLYRIIVNKMANFVRCTTCTVYTPQKNSEKSRPWQEKVRHAERERDQRRTVQSPPYFTLLLWKAGGVEVFGVRWHIKSTIVSRRHWNMDVISPNKPAQLRHIRNALQRPGKSYLPLSPSLLMQRETLSKHRTNIQTEREREVG